MPSDRSVTARRALEAVLEEHGFEADGRAAQLAALDITVAAPIEMQDTQVAPPGLAHPEGASRRPCLLAGEPHGDQSGNSRRPGRFHEENSPFRERIAKGAIISPAGGIWVLA